MNDQTPLGLDRRPNGDLFVHSIFRTIQGEGPFAGHPSIFIRLYGCNLQCPECDTEYTQRKMDGSLATIFRQLNLLPDYRLIVITGGEPFRQNIIPLVWELLNANKHVQIESNGVLYPGDDFPWDHERVTVVVSPKTGKIHPKTALRATAYKYVLAWDSVAPDGLPETALGHTLGGFSTVARPPVGWEGDIYLNPMDSKHEIENIRNMKAVVQSCLNNGTYIMGVQMHKLTGLP